MSWNIGNTTVRNPRRIQDGLKIFAAEFNGNIDSPTLESNYAHRLIANGIVESDKQAGEILDWHGRKWRSCFANSGLFPGTITIKSMEFKLNSQIYRTKGLV